MAKRPQSIASQHADWLRLIEVSGPFLSLPVLVQTFGHGLDKIESEAMRRIRTGYAEWKEGTRSDAADRVWIETVITGLLEHEAASLSRFDESSKVPSTLRHRVEEHAEVLAPQIVIKEADRPLPDGTRVLVCIFPRAQRLDRAVTGSRWSASPQSRMAELCRATGVRLGLVTNGEQWTLVDAPKDETIGYATWYAQLWLDEPGTLSAFRSLLGRHRLFAVGQDETLETLLTKSRENQHEVTTQLGLQVRRAVEVLVRALDRADQDSKRALLKDTGVTEIYQAAVTVMMRLVFLLSAEERGLLLLGDPLFDRYYAVSTLCEQLREVADQHGEEVLERRRDAWCRLLAAFRAVHGGVQHDRLQIRAYGGGLFDPDRFPFLEGRPGGTAWKATLADPLPIDNRTVLHALESLQFLQVKIGSHVESRRLSFRSLGIEQIGHVYEGLLDHTAVRAKDITLGLLGPDGAEAEVPLAALEEKRRRGETDLIDFLHEHKVKSGKPAIKKLLTAEVPAALVGRMERLCRDAATWKRVEPFAPLIRDDDFGQPIILLPGQLYATAGQDRSDTGTQYTPVSLTQPVVEHALVPLVYIGPAEGKPREEWQLRSAKELLDLKVCDMACGSGAFLVQACRYLADRLLDAWAIAEEAAPAPNPSKLTFPTITFDGTAAKGERDLVPRDPDERLLVARRLIAQRCLYGVDINPVAAEMAKLSIWLLTLSKDKPFSFLDHAIRSGDALLGLHDLEQLRRFTLDRSGKEEVTFNQLRMTDLIEKASGTRLQIEHINSENIGHVQVQARLLGEAEKQTERLKFAADMLIAGYLLPARSAGERLDAISSAAIKAGQLVLSGSSDDLREYGARALGGKKPFHWCLEFPEVIGAGGFDAILGNPPYLFGERRPHLPPTLYKLHVRQWDLCWLFVERAIGHLTRSSATLGLILPDSILTREDPGLVRDLVVAKSRRIQIAHFGTAFKAGVSVFGLVSETGADHAHHLTYSSPSFAGADRTHVSLGVLHAHMGAKWMPPWPTRSGDSVERSWLRLGDYVTISRGEEVGKKDLASVEESTREGMEAVVAGAGVEGLLIQPLATHCMARALVQKSRSIYAAPKIIAVKTGKAVRAGIDYIGYVTLQSAYNIQMRATPPLGPVIPLECICALLVSEAANSRYILPVTGGKKLFPQITQTMIAEIRFPVLTTEHITILTNAVREYVQAPSTAGLANIESNVAAIYASAS